MNVKMINEFRTKMIEKHFFLSLGMYEHSNHVIVIVFTFIFNSIKLELA